MRRRQFIQMVAGSGSAFALLGTAPAGGSDAQRGKGAGDSQAVPPLEEMTIPDLQNGMRSGIYSALSLVEAYRTRIEKLDKQGPSVNSMIQLNPDAPAIADEMDKERRSGKVRGPLHGIPVVIKDNIDTADKMNTTAGSLALNDWIAAQDSFVAKKLREAGAIILGKTNLSEWANFRSTRSSSGWSARGGQTKNPFALDRNPCGSSSGPGAAVSSNLCAAGIGTETDGSVVCPASSCGVVGIKPTVGLISRSGIIPISHRQDTAGPMTRTVTDAAIMLAALTGVDERDAETMGSLGMTYPDYTQFLDPQGMNGARIGVARKMFGFHDQVDKLMEEAIQVMKDLGAIVIDPADIETNDKYEDSDFEALLFEFKADINRYLGGVGKNIPVHSLKELIDFNEANKEKEMPYFGQEIFVMAEKKGDLADENYLKAVEKVKRLSREEGIDATLSKHKVDAIIAPTDGPAWLTDWITGDHYLGGSSSPAARAGYPDITVPAGFVSGLPVGISFFSRAYSEPTLLKLAYAFEQATKHRRPPRFLPHAEA